MIVCIIYSLVCIKYFKLYIIIPYIRHIHSDIPAVASYPAGSAFGAADPGGRSDALRLALLGGAAPRRSGGQQHALGAACGTAPGMHGQGGIL